MTDQEFTATVDSEPYIKYVAGWKHEDAYATKDTTPTTTDDVTTPYDSPSTSAAEAKAAAAQK